MDGIYSTLKNFWTRDKSFTFLLGTLVVYLFWVTPFLLENIFSKISFVVFYYLLLTSSMPFLLRKNKKMAAAVLFLLPFILLVIEIYAQSVWTQIFTDFIVVFYCVMLGYVILIRTFEKGKFSIRRVQGAIIVYLLAALVFCLLYHSIYLMSAVKSFSGMVGSHRNQFLYFSLCTLTTDGYGDILPVTPLVRSLTNMESLIGMLYPAVLIARLVSMESYYAAENKS
jgi:hypothetical protein